MASLRIVPAAKANQLYQDLKVRFEQGTSQLVFEKANGTDVARSTLTPDEAYALRSQLPAPPEPTPDPEPDPVPEPTPVAAPLGIVRYASDTNQNPSVVDPLHKHRFIILAGTWKASDVAKIKQADPNCKVLCYINISRTRAPNQYADYNSALTLAESRSNQYGVNWDSGVPDSDAGGVIVKPLAATQYGQFAARRTIERLKGTAWDGVFWDDCNSFAPDVHGGTGDATTWNAWMETVNKTVAPLMKAAGLLTMANLSGCIGQRNLESKGWEERQFGIYDYGFDEFFLTWGSGALMDQTKINEACRVMRAHPNYIAVTHSTTEAMARAGLCATLCFGATGFSAQPYAGTEKWWPVYDQAAQLGAPLGPATNSGGIWTRQFEHGKVTFDQNAKTGQIA